MLDENKIKNPTITILGVSYKANIGDTRETPALKLIKLCEKEGWNVNIHDHLVKNFEYPLLSLEDAVKDSDLIIVEAGHDEFRKMNVELVSNLVRNKNIIDTVNILDTKLFLEIGFNVKILGANL